MEFGRETLHKYLLTKWILESERKEYVPWLEQSNFYEFIRSLFTLSPNTEEPQWHKEICCFSMAAVNTRRKNWPLSPELPLFASDPFHSEHTQGCPCLLKVKCDPMMEKCPSQGTLLELVHVLLTKQQWSREKMHCPPRSWPRRHAEMALPPMVNSSQRNQGAGPSGGDPWVHELFLHCGLCFLWSPSQWEDQSWSSCRLLMALFLFPSSSACHCLCCQVSFLSVSDCLAW